MNFIRNLFTLWLLTFWSLGECFAQTVPWHVDTTSTMHTIYIDATVNPSFNNSPLSVGDAIGVFYTDSGMDICCGYGIWTGNVTSIIAYGAEGTIPGFASNQLFSFKYWNKANNCSSKIVYALFNSSTTSPMITAGNSFVPGGVSQLGRFTVSLSGYSYTPTIFSNYSSFCLPNLTSSGSTIYLNYSGVLDNTYFQSTAGLSVNSTTGNIDLLHSTFGVHTVTAFSESCLYSNNHVVALDSFPSRSVRTDVSFCPGTSISLFPSYTASGYQWSSREYTPSISVTQPGLYTLTVVGASGCLSVDTFSVTNYPTNFVQLGRDTVLCQSSYPILFNTTGTGYLWSTGQTTTGILVTSSGVYWGEMAQNGCVSRDSISISFHSPPQLFLGNDVSTCTGTTVYLVSSSTAAGYLWSTGATTSGISVNQPGLYSLTISGVTGCSSVDSVSVSYFPQTFVQLGRDTVVCQSSYPISFNTTGTGYLWSTGQTTTGILVTSSGVYWGEMAQNGCVSRDSISISFHSLPQVFLGNDVSTCAGTTVFLVSSSTATGYLWSTGATTSGISVNQPGLYSLTISGATGCSSVDSIAISFSTFPAFSLGRDTVICQGLSLRLAPTQTGSGYLWSTGSTANTILVSTAGVYTLTLTSAFGCQQSSSVQLTIASVPSFSLGKDTSICFGNPLVLAPTISASQFNWSTGATSSSISVTTGGMYFLKVRSSDGCTFSDTLFLTDKNILLSALEWKSQPAKCNQLGQLEINENTIKNVTPPIQYSLKNTFTNQSFTQSSSIFDSKDGLYELLVTDANGCTATYPQPLLISKTEDCKNPILAPNSNGTLGSVFIPLPGTVKIYDKNGVLKKQFLAPNEWDGTDESGQILPMGDYFLVSSESNQTLTITILK